MSVMVAELYDALVAAGAPEDKARAAAITVSEENLATKADIARIDKRLTVIDGELKLLKWMNGIMLAGVASLVVKSFF
jgi:hypothetical protein